MFNVPFPLQHVGLTLTLGTIFCLFLEMAGLPEGFFRTDARPHIAIISLLSLFSAFTALCWQPFTHFSSEPSILVMSPLIYVTIALILYMAVCAVALGSIQLQHMKLERGEIYGMLLWSVWLAITLCSAQNSIFIGVNIALCSLCICHLSLFRQSRFIICELSIKWALGSQTWFIFFILSGVFCLLSGCYSFHFTNIAAQLALQNNVIIQLALAFLLLSLLFFMGCFPFYGFHIDYLEGAPEFASVIFTATTLLGTGTVFLHLVEALCVKNALDSQLFYLLFVIGVTSWILPNLLAIDQRRLGRVCGYLLLSQAGFIVMAALLLSPPNKMGKEFFALLLANIAILTPGLLGGLQFWKHPLQKEKTWEDYAGAGRKHPIIAMTWLMCMASLAGLPGTFGFPIHLVFIETALAQQQSEMAIILAAGSLLGAASVLRLGIFLFAKPTHHQLTAFHRPRQGLVTIISGFFILLGGFAPNFFAWLIRWN